MSWLSPPKQGSQQELLACDHDSTCLLAYEMVQHRTISVRTTLTMFGP